MASKRALIVDDSKTAQYRLKKLLRGYDLDIVAVDSAEAALSYLSSSVPDVVFMDHLMPGMDGFRALQIIKSHPATATIPVIMYTSKSGDLYTSEARALGALDVVSKDSIDAADLRKVLTAIHIYEKDASEAETGAKADPEPERPKPTVPTPVESPEKILSVELRLRELEHTIDDNRRIITSRLVREMQGVRHQVRKLVEHTAELKQRSDAQLQTDQNDPSEAEPPPTRSGGGRLWAAAASIALLALTGIMLVWIPEMSRKLDDVAEVQDRMGERMVSLAESGNQSRPVAASRVLPQADSDDSMALLPDLSWAINQHSVQGFHADLVSPDLTQRLSELVSRLASRDFEGRIRVNVSGGNFCVVTNLSGEPELPREDAYLRDCMLMSELYGAETTQEMAERLDSALAESAILNHNRIQVVVEPLTDSFAEYPSFHSQTSAQRWNEAARMNNRILVNLEPATPARTAHRD